MATKGGWMAGGTFEKLGGTLGGTNQVTLSPLMSPRLNREECDHISLYRVSLRDTVGM